MKIECVSDTYGGDPSDWRPVGHGAFAHKDAHISDECDILGPAVFRDGVFRGGVFRAGVFWGGVFWGGEFWDGVFRGGVFRDGVFRGGVFWGGVFWGGEFLDGVFRGGEFRGGVFLDGEFRGGVSFCGVLPWTVSLASPTEVAVGCQVRTLDEWKNGDWNEFLEEDDVILDTDVKSRAEKLLAFIESLPRDLWPQPDRESRSTYQAEMMLEGRDPGQGWED